MFDLSRRKFVLILSALVSDIVLEACGSDNNATPTTVISATPTTVKTVGLAPTAALTVSGSVNSTSTPNAALPRRGGSLTTAISSDANIVHPYKLGLAQGYEYVQYWFNAQLARRDPKTLEIIPSAAASWSIDQANATVTYKLRTDIKWSDGTPITADDYAWTYQQATKKENAWPAVGPDVIYDPTQPRDSAIESYTAPDSTTIVVKLHGLVFNMLEATNVIQPLPRHIWENKDWNDPTKNPEINHPTVVSGPWQLKEWVPNSHLTVTANPNSTLWPVPYLDSVTYTVIPDSNIAFQKLKNGELDFYSTSEQDEKAAESLANYSTYKWVTGRSWDYVGINFRKPYLQDVHLRQALMLAMDRQSIIDNVLYGLGIIQYTDVSQVSSYYNPNVNKWSYDPAKAKQVLKDAGYTLNSNGELVDPKGQLLPALKLRHSAPSEARAKTAAVIQQNWQDIGINLQLVPSEVNSFFEALVTPPFDYDFWLLNWSTGLNPEEFGGIWLNIPEGNRGDWVNKQVNDLYAQAVKELDVTKRKAIMFQIQDLESQQLPYIYFYTRMDHLTISKNIKGVTTGPLGLVEADFNQIYQWYL